MAPQTSIKLTYEDYAAIPDDGRRHEIIDGEHYVNPAPSPYHQIILARVSFPLFQHVENHQLGLVLFAPVDVLLGEHGIVQPDAMFISTAHAELVGEKKIHGAPDLIVEILSESNRRYDVRIKYEQYERAGVSEYWIVDPDEMEVRVFRRVSGKFERIDVGDAITTPLLPGFTLPLSAIFRM